jgi:hypothetical protein
LFRLQRKAAETLKAVRSSYVYDLDTRDYNLWMVEELPVFLVRVPKRQVVNRRAIARMRDLKNGKRIRIAGEP